MMVETLSVDVVAWAKASAILAHESVGQCRKYGNAHYGKERYYFHPCRVAELVATVTDDKNVIAAAALHDVLEDVSPKSEIYTPTWLLASFGPEVLFYVMECSNFYSKDEEQRVVLVQTLDVLQNALSSMHTEHLLQLRCQALEAFMVANKSNREQRKQLEATRYATISDGAKIIKRADLFDNSLSMDGAPADFAKRWHAERKVAESLIGSWLDFEKSCRKECALT